MQKILIALATFILATIIGIYITKQNIELVLYNDNINVLTDSAKNVNIIDDESLNICTLREEVKDIYKQKETKKDRTQLNRDNNQIISRSNNERCTTIKAIVTAYAPYDNKSGICNDGNPNSTSTGTKPKMGTLAADPKRIPYGTRLYIDGYGYGVVEDTGGALRSDKNNIRIDVFMKTYEEAMEWGRKEMIIYIVD